MREKETKSLGKKWEEEEEEGPKFIGSILAHGIGWVSPFG